MEQTYKYLPMWAKLRVAYGYASTEELKQFEEMVKTIIERNRDKFPGLQNITCNPMATCLFKCLVAFEGSCGFTTFEMAACTESCTNQCTGGCQLKCTDQCTNSCTDSCTRLCTDSCTENCTDSCTNKCTESCTYKCTNACTQTCTDVNEHARVRQNKAMQI